MTKINIFSLTNVYYANTLQKKSYTRLLKHYKIAIQQKICFESGKIQTRE